MRLYAALSLALVACAPDAASTPDAASDAPPDVAVEAAAPADAVSPSPDIPCGGLCGRGTVCTLNRCVAVPTEDAGADAMDASDADVVDAVRDAPTDTTPDAPSDVLPDGCVSQTVGNCCGVSCALRPHTERMACLGGRCGIDACSYGYGDCDGDAVNGCETFLSSNRMHCGACGNACRNDPFQVCVSGACR